MERDFIWTIKDALQWPTIPDQILRLIIARVNVWTATP